MILDLLNLYRICLLVLGQGSLCPQWAFNKSMETLGRTADTYDLAGRTLDKPTLLPSQPPRQTHDRSTIVAPLNTGKTHASPTFLRSPRAAMGLAADNRLPALIPALLPASSTRQHLPTKDTTASVAALLLGGNDGVTHLTKQVENWPACPGRRHSLPALPNLRINRPGAAVLDGTIFLCGGQDRRRRFYKSDCITLGGDMREWVAGPDLRETRAWFTLNAVGKSLVAAFGHGLQGESSTVEIYNQDDWRMGSVPPGTISRRSHCAVTISDEEILFLGGTSMQVPVSALNTVDKYNVRTGELSHLSSMPGDGRKGLACTLFQGEVMVTGGYTGSQYLTSVISLDLGSGLWTAMPSMNHIRSYHTLDIVNGNPVVFGSGLVGTVEILRNGKWEVDQMKINRSYHAMVILPCTKLR